MDGKLAFCHGRKKLWTELLGPFRAKIKYIITPEYNFSQLKLEVLNWKHFLENYIRHSAKTFIIKILTDGSHRWKKKSQMAKKNFVLQFPNIYCSLFIPLKPTRDISR